MNASPEPFPNRLRTMMATSSFTQAALARMSGLDEAHVSRLLSGKRPLSPVAAAKLAGALDVSPTTLLRGTDVEQLLREDGSLSGVPYVAIEALRTAERARRALVIEQASHEVTRAALAEARAELATLQDLRLRIAAVVPELRSIALIAGGLKDEAAG